MLQRLRAANPAAVEKCATCRLEIGNIVAAARVADHRMAVCDARIGDLQAESRRLADNRLVAAKYQQSRTRRVAINCE